MQEYVPDITQFKAKDNVTTDYLSRVKFCKLPFLDRGRVLWRTYANTIKFLESSRV